MRAGSRGNNIVKTFAILPLDLMFRPLAHFICHLLSATLLHCFFTYIWIVKIASFIFALYTAALSVYPCYEDDCVDEVGIVNTINKDAHQQESPDLCSPFCVSTCCAVHAFCTPRLESAFASLNNSIAENSTYTISFVPVVVVSIWQPPKLA